MHSCGSKQWGTRLDSISQGFFYVYLSPQFQSRTLNIIGTVYLCGVTDSSFGHGRKKQIIFHWAGNVDGRYFGRKHAFITNIERLFFQRFSVSSLPCSVPIRQIPQVRHKINSFSTGVVGRRAARGEGRAAANFTT